MTIENGETQNSKKRAGVQLSEREVSHVIIVLLVGAICIFLAGYFLGKKRMFEEVASIDEMQFADKITAALDSIGKGGLDDAESVGGGDDDDEESEQVVTPVATPAMAPANLVQNPIQPVTFGTSSLPAISPEFTSGLSGAGVPLLASQQTPLVSSASMGMSQTKKAYAKLCGFGSLSAAEAYVERVKKYGITVKVEAHSSYTTSGKEVIWYQVVTDSMPKDALASLVRLLKKKDRLRNVVVVDSPG